MRPHSSVVRFIRNYGRRVCKPIGGVRRPLDVVYNPAWHQKYLDDDGRVVELRHKGARFTVVQRIPVVEDSDHIDGFSYSKVIKFPVLFVPHASHIDWSWIEALEESKLDQCKERMLREDAEREAKLKKKYMDFTEGFAKEYYDLFRRESEGYNLANVKAVNPTEKRKRMEDKKGRRLR